MKINRPDDLGHIANLGLALADGKLLLAGLQHRSLPRRLGAMPFDGRIAEAVVRFAM
jgi:hypothetical protein